ncbi:MAG: fatty acyl-AMP ligase [Desulfosarcina sp.]|nr:fatty acyl-AMP ligase [Desulfobacterales bacterium]
MLKATPTQNGLQLRYGDFSTLTEALDYAAQGETGYNFYNGRGQLDFVLPYAKLREDAVAIAKRLMGLKIERGSRVALVADTEPGFHQLFYACQYAGMVPVPLPASLRLGGHKTYVAQLRLLLKNCRAGAAIAPQAYLSFLSEAAENLPLSFIGSVESLMALPEGAAELAPSGPDELAYMQYTSGSTRFPRGVMITNRTVMNNLGHIVRNGIKIRPNDRAISWLPYYHDMGLVGLVLSPMAAQVSVDYMRTRDFAMRPRLWLSLITQNKATISFSPPFGFELCMQRLRESDLTKYNLSSWRVAGVGAETIRAQPLLKFSEMLAPSGFNPGAFLACYGMAECSLAVSFSPLGQGIQVDEVEAETLARSQRAFPALKLNPRAIKAQEFVKCGFALPGHTVEVRDAQGNPLPERHVGTLFVKGPSVMAGYFGEKELTQEILSSDGWLNTGDLAYIADQSIIITGRQKDLIIINGRNIWPQDLEYLAENQPEVRTGDASAFSVVGVDGDDKAVLVIECRESNPEKRSALVNNLQGLVCGELSIECYIELVPRNTLPRTTSGKLSRSGAKHDFLQRVAEGKTESPGIDAEACNFQHRIVSVAVGRR